jgi:hypothetical protein
MADDHEHEDHQHEPSHEHVDGEKMPIVQPGSKVELAAFPMVFEVEVMQHPQIGRVIVHVYHTPIGVFRFAGSEDWSKACAADLQANHTTAPGLEVVREMPKILTPPKP